MSVRRGQFAVDVAFKVDVPKFALSVENERELLGALAESMHSVLTRRVGAGRDFEGNLLPAPKDGGVALYRTGQLLRSIRPTVRGSPSRGYVAFAGPVTRSRRRVARILSRESRAREGETRAAYRVFYLSPSDLAMLQRMTQEKLRARLRNA